MSLQSTVLMARIGSLMSDMCSAKTGWLTQVRPRLVDLGRAV